MTDEMGDSGSVETGSGAGSSDAPAPPVGGEAPNAGAGSEDLQYDLPLDYTQKSYRPEVQELLDAVETQVVYTAKDGAIFWSGPGNEKLALQWAEMTGRVMLEHTSGGQWLKEQNLYPKEGDPNPRFTKQEADLIWSRLSHRFADQASGVAFAFVRGAAPDRVFWGTEARVLNTSSKMTKVLM
jgi:hypothetical protein